MIEYNNVQTLKNKLLAEISNAAKENDTAKIYEATDRLRRFESLLDEAVLLANPSSATRRHNLDISPAKISDNSSNSGDNVIRNRKERGKFIRNEWVKHIFSKLGKTLSPISGALYRNGKGEVLGIAVATERKISNAKSWWFGLPDGKFHCAALLCTSRENKVLSICLPKDFINLYAPKLSRSNVGQIQFTIIKRDEIFYLRLKSSDPIEVTKYIDSYSNVI